MEKNPPEFGQDWTSLEDSYLVNKVNYKYRSCLRFFEESKNKVFIFNGHNKKILSVGRKEYSFLMKLDGTLSLSDLENKSPEFSRSEIIALIQLFVQYDLLEGFPTHGQNVFKFKVGIIQFGDAMKHGRLRIALKVAIVIATILSTIGILHIYTCGGINIDRASIISLVDFQNLIWGYVYLVTITFIHELSHALMAQYYGAFVPEIGIMSDHFLIRGYSTIVGIDCLKKSQKCVIYIAGIIGNMVSIGLSFFLYTNGSRLNDAIVVFAFANYMMAIFNMLPLFNLDGKRIVQEIFDSNTITHRDRMSLVLLSIISGSLSSKFGIVIPVFVELILIAISIYVMRYNLMKIGKYAYYAFLTFFSVSLPFVMRTDFLHDLWEFGGIPLVIEALIIVIANVNCFSIIAGVVEIIINATLTRQLKRIIGDILV